MTARREPVRVTYERWALKTAGSNLATMGLSGDVITWNVGKGPVRYEDERPVRVRVTVEEILEGSTDAEAER